MRRELLGNRSAGDGRGEERGQGRAAVPDDLLDVVPHNGGPVGPQRRRPLDGNHQLPLRRRRSRHPPPPAANLLRGLSLIQPPALASPKISFFSL